MSKRQVVPAKLASAALILIGVSVLLGWTFNLPFLKSVLPSFASMSANTAVGFAGIGVGLWLLSDEHVGQSSRYAAIFCGTAVLLLGVLTLSEYIFGWNLGIDELLFNDPASALHPGRMAEITAISFTLLGLSLLMLVNRRYWFMQSLALIILFMGLLTLLGYLYGASSLYRVFAFSSVALHTAAGIVISGAGLLSARSQQGLMAEINANSPGGMMARRLLPAVVLVPITVGWLRLRGQQEGLYGTEFGLALFALANICIFAALIWWNARSLNRADDERKQTDSDLRKSEERFRLLLESAPEAIVIVDSQGKIRLINAHTETLFGYTREEMYGQAVEMLIPERFSKHHVRDRDNYTAAPSARYMGIGRDLAGQRKDGTEFPIEVALSAVETAEGLLMAAFIADITERKRAEAALLESERRYHRTLDNLLEAVQIIGFDWRYLYINEAAAGHGRQPRELLLNNSMLELYPGIENSEMFGKLRKCMEERTTQQFENEFVYAEGDSVWFELSVQPIPEGIFILSLDISERKRTETALKRYAQRMEILHEIDLGIINAVAVEEVVQTVLKLIRQVIPCQRTSVVLFDATTEMANIFANDSAKPYSIDTKLQVPLPPNWIEEFGAQSRIFSDLRLVENPLPVYKQLINDGLVSGIQTLLMDSGRPIGFLGLNADTPNFFTTEHQEIAVEIANQLAIAVKQLQMSQELRHHAQTVEGLHQFLQTTLDAFPANTTVLDADGTIITANIPWKQFADENDGRSDTHYIGSNYLKICDAAVGAMSAEAAVASAGIGAVMAGKQDDFYLEYPCDSPTTKRWFMLRVTPFAEPTPRRVVVAHIDITEHKKAEKALQESYNTLEQRVKQRTGELQAAKERVEAILNNNASGIVFVHPDFTIQQSNPAFNDMFACDADDYFDQPLTTLLHPDDVEKTISAIQVGMAEKHTVNIEARARRRNRREFDAELRIGFIKTGGFVCAISDISERKSQERQLRYHASLQENVSDAVIVTDMAFRIQSWNKAAERIYGWSAEEVINRVTTEILRSEFGSSAKRDQSVQHLREQGWWQGEVVQRHKDGTIRNVLEAVTQVKDENGLPFGVVSINHDISERKKAEEALNARVEEEREFQSYLKALHEITIELTQLDDLDTFYKRAIELGLERLGFERLAMFLYDEKDGAAIGTYGTDAQGNLVNESNIRFMPDPNGILLRAFNRAERFYFNEEAPLYDSMKPVGIGWNAAAVLWNGTQRIGWFVADNLLSKAPKSKPLLDILGLYALTVGTLLAQKRTQLDLVDREERFRQYFELPLIGMALTSPDQGWLQVNDKLCEMLGYSREELTRKTWSEITYPDDIAGDMKQFEQLLAGKIDGYSIDKRFIRKDGNIIFTSITIRAVRHADGRFNYSVGLMQDITERKRAEEALKRNEQLLQMILDNLPVGVWMIDPNGMIMLGNPAGQQIWAGAKYVGMDQFGEYKAWRLDTGKRLEAEDWSASRAIRKGEVSINEELEIEAFDGTHKYILNSSVPIRDEQGNILGAITVNQDITERRLIAGELDRQRTFLRQVIDVSPSMIFVKDYNGRFILVNPMVAKMYDSTVEDLIGKTNADINSSPTEIEAFLEADRRVITSGEPLFIEEVLTSSDGDTHWLQTTKVPIVSADGKSKYVLGVATDITERKKSEEALRQAFEKERELGELKSRFVSMASHEFRTPLATILALTETLMAYRRQLPDDQIEVRLGKIQDQVAHLKDIMEDVLLLARMQARRVEFNPAKIDLDALCRSVIDEFHSRPDVTHNIVYKCDEQLQEVTLDKKLMRQIINNLMSNAVKYSAGDKTITISLSCEDEHLILKVQDEGIGIPEADMKYLFEPFHRAANVGAISGTGLGMVIAKESVELHSGTITVESQVGVGTTFTVNIPLN